MYSCWIPQIIYNIIHGTRRAFSYKFLLGNSLSRLFIPLYFLLCPSNFINLLLTENAINNYTNQTWQAGLVLIIWTLFQIICLISQDLFGARFFLPKCLFPQPYDYNRRYTRLRTSEDVLNNEINNENLSGNLSGNQQDIESANLPECVICYNCIDIHSSSNYMVNYFN